MSLEDESCRWGILGTASIARKNWHAILNAGNSRIVAVASRSAESARRFVGDCQASVPAPGEVDAIEGYRNLLARDDIDAVYIPLPTAIRTDWALEAVRAGKHVVIEKPGGVDVTALQRLVDAAAQAGVQLMDGSMFPHSTRLPMLRQILDDGHSTGEIRRIATHFSFIGDPAWIERNSQLEPAGCLGDVGWYDIRLILFALRYELPTEVRGRTLAGIARVDGSGVTPTEFHGELAFASGATATLYCAFNTSRQQWAWLSGTRGYLYLKDFVLPHFGNEVSFTIGNDGFSDHGCYFNLERHERTIALPEYSNNHPTAQETRLFRTFAALVLAGERDPFWPEVALKTQRVVDALLRSADRDGAPVSLT